MLPLNAYRRTADGSPMTKDPVNPDSVGVTTPTAAYGLLSLVPLVLVIVGLAAVSSAGSPFAGPSRSHRHVASAVPAATVDSTTSSISVPATNSPAADRPESSDQLQRGHRDPGVERPTAPDHVRLPDTGPQAAPERTTPSETAVESPSTSTTLTPPTVVASAEPGVESYGLSPLAIDWVDGAGTTANRPPVLNVLAHGVTGDGRTDDTAAIQLVLDSAPSGSIIRFPDVSPAHYRLTAPLHITRPVSLVGEGGTSGSELRQTSSATSGIVIQSSDVVIESLRLIGPGYRSFEGDSALSIDASDAQRLQNITVVDSWLQGWSNSGIRWHFVDDFIVANNHIEDCTYAGVLIVSGNRGLIANNTVVDIGDPAHGVALNNAYSIVVTAVPGAPYSTDVIIRNNVVSGNPIWSGIMNHGGERVLIADNEVRHADVAYAVTWIPGSPQSSDQTLFINNLAVSAPRNSLWLTGDDDRPTSGSAAIGNRFIDSADIITYSQRSATITWNSATGTTSAHGALRLRRTVTDLTVAHNDWGGAPTTGDPVLLTYAAAPPPPPPPDLTAERVGGEIVLQWSYEASTAHDSFLIEQRTDHGPWLALAFRPPADGTWSFDAPSNPLWQPFDPRTYSITVPEQGSHEFRIRAQLGGTVSAWSPTAVA